MSIKAKSFWGNESPNRDLENKNKKSEIVLLLLREVVRSHYRCAKQFYDNEHFKKEGVRCFSGTLLSTEERQRYHRYLGSRVSLLERVLEEDLNVTSVNKTELEYILGRAMIPMADFHQYMHVVIFTAIKDTFMCNPKDRDTNLSWENYKKYAPCKVDGLILMEQHTPGYFPKTISIAKGKINERKLKKIYKEYTFNGLDEKIEAAFEIFDMMDPIFYDEHGIVGSWAEINKMLWHLGGNRHDEVINEVPFGFSRKLTRPTVRRESESNG